MEYEAKVSLLSPCYNVSQYLPTFLGSVLSQSYLPYEVILVDDGSTDCTAEVIEQYRSAFEEKGINYRYIWKENGGQASAIAKGLPLVTGDYLIWPDSDDFLLEDSIRKRVRYMECHPDCGIVRSNGYIYDEKNTSKPIGEISKRKKTRNTLEDFVKFIVPWCPGCYMIRMAALDHVNPERKIFCSVCGQNIQMLLPLVSVYPCHYLDAFLFGYVIHEKSHSHKKKTYEEASRHIDDMKECVDQTLKILHGDFSEYIELHNSFNRRVHFETAWQYEDVCGMERYEAEMRRHGAFYVDYWIRKYIPPKSKAAGMIRYISAIRRRIIR